MPHPNALMGCFDLHLPHVNFPPNPPGYRRFVTATAKQHIEPIPYFRPELASNLAAFSQHTLQKPEMQNALKDETCPGFDPTHCLKTEADVVRAATVYLINPVNIALCALLPKGASISVHSEANAKESRFDMQWVLALSNKAITLAILEVKNTNIIRQSDFIAGECHVGEEQASSTGVHDTEFGTHLEDNAIAISQQVMQYAKHCDDVAVFDWHSMAVFNFSVLNETGWGRPVDMAFFDAHDKIPGTPGKLNFRHLLLGFLLRALQRHIEIDKDNPNSIEAHRSMRYDETSDLSLVTESGPEQDSKQASEQGLEQDISELSIYEDGHSEASISSEDPLSSGVTVGKSKGRGY